MNLDGRWLRVSVTAAAGVVDAGTRLHLMQRGERVLGRYAGGRIARGCLVGRVAGGRLVFHYVQREVSGAVHAGHSDCRVYHRDGGGVRIVEHFQWTTRPGGGVNVFDE